MERKRHCFHVSYCTFACSDLATKILLISMQMYVIGSEIRVVRLLMMKGGLSQTKYIVH